MRHPRHRLNPSIIHGYFRGAFRSQTDSCGATGLGLYANILFAILVCPFEMTFIYGKFALDARASYFF